MTFHEILFNGLVIGTLYTLIALGLTVAFGMMRIVNFAHGELYTIGAYVAISMLAVLGTTRAFVAAILLGPLVAASVGYVMDFTVLRKLYDRHELTTLLATWGFALILRQSFRTIWGSTPQNIGFPIVGQIPLLGIRVSSYRVFVLAFGVTCIAIILLFFKNSSLGLMSRATIQNRELASASGIDTAKTSRYMFSLGAAVAALAGVLFAPIGATSPTTGETIIVISFMIVIMGGMGSIRGTILASYVVGMIDSIVGTIYDPVIARGVVFVLVLLIMVIRFGEIKETLFRFQIGRKIDV